MTTMTQEYQTIRFHNTANGNEDVALIFPAERPDWYNVWWLEGDYADEHWVTPDGQDTPDPQHPDTMAYIVNGLIFLPADGQAGAEDLFDEDGMPRQYLGWYEATTGHDAIIWPDGTLVILM